MAVGLYFFRKVVVRIQVEGMKLGLKHGGFIIAMESRSVRLRRGGGQGSRRSSARSSLGVCSECTPLRRTSRGRRLLGAVFTPIFFISLGRKWTSGALEARSSSSSAWSSRSSDRHEVVGAGSPACFEVSRHEAASVGGA